MDYSGVAAEPAMDYSGVAERSNNLTTL